MPPLCQSFVEEFCSLVILLCPPPSSLCDQSSRLQPWCFFDERRHLIAMWWIVVMDKPLSRVHGQVLKSIITSQSSPFPLRLSELPPTSTSTAASMASEQHLVSACWLYAKVGTPCCWYTGSSIQPSVRKYNLSVCSIYWPLKNLFWKAKSQKGDQQLL